MIIDILLWILRIFLYILGIFLNLSDPDQDCPQDLPLSRPCLHRDIPGQRLQAQAAVPGGNNYRQRDHSLVSGFWRLVAAVVDLPHL